MKIEFLAHDLCSLNKWHQDIVDPGPTAGRGYAAIEEEPDIVVIITTTKTIAIPRLYGAFDVVRHSADIDGLKVWSVPGIDQEQGTRFGGVIDMKILNSTGGVFVIVETSEKRWTISASISLAGLRHFDHSRRRLLQWMLSLLRS